MDEVEERDAGGEDGDAGDGERAAAADVDHPPEEGPDGDGDDAEDAHDEADLALARGEGLEEDGQVEEERDGHVEAEEAGDAEEKIPVPEGAEQAAGPAGAPASLRGHGAKDTL